MKRLSYPEITKELADFLDVESGASEDAENAYWWQRGAIEFAKYLEAATAEPLQL